MTTGFEAITGGAKDMLMNTITTVKLFPILINATSEDENPTPGYIFDEIAG